MLNTLVRPRRYSRRVSSVRGPSAGSTSRARHTAWVTGRSSKPYPSNRAVLRLMRSRPLGACHSQLPRSAASSVRWKSGSSSSLEDGPGGPAVAAGSVPCGTSRMTRNPADPCGLAMQSLTPGARTWPRGALRSTVTRPPLASSARCARSRRSGTTSGTSPAIRACIQAGSPDRARPLATRTRPCLPHQTAGSGRSSSENPAGTASPPVVVSGGSAVSAPTRSSEEPASGRAGVEDTETDPLELGIDSGAAGLNRQGVRDALREGRT